MAVNGSFFIAEHPRLFWGLFARDKHSNDGKSVPTFFDYKITF